MEYDPDDPVDPDSPRPRLHYDGDYRRGAVGHRANSGSPWQAQPSGIRNNWNGFVFVIIWILLLFIAIFCLTHILPPSPHHVLLPSQGGPPTTHVGPDKPLRWGSGNRIVMDNWKLFRKLFALQKTKSLR